MKIDAAAIVIVVVLLILIFLFMSAKGEKRRVTLVNSDGERFELSVEVANNSITRSKGLMGRSSLGENEGMLFEFDRMGIYPFWMLNTTIPLDAIFIASDGSVVDVLEMEPCGLNITRCRLYTPKAEAQYVLEMNLGFSSKRSIIPGNSSLLIK